MFWIKIAKKTFQYFTYEKNLAEFRLLNAKKLFDNQLK